MRIDFAIIHNDYPPAVTAIRQEDSKKMLELIWDNCTGISKLETKLLSYMTYGSQLVAKALELLNTRFKEISSLKEVIVHRRSKRWSEAGDACQWVGSQDYASSRRRRRRRRGGGGRGLQRGGRGRWLGWRLYHDAWDGRMTGRTSLIITGSTAVLAGVTSVQAAIIEHAGNRCICFWVKALVLPRGCIFTL